MTVKAKKISPLGRWLMIAAAVLTIVCAFLPLWRIDLTAPQYPEGLELLIGGFSGISGNLDSINDLNHYVGMAKIFPDAFWEFKALPCLLCAFGLLFLLSAMARSRKMTLWSFLLFCVFGVLSFVDFYYWTYNYGHNLDPDAPIKVPGMAYQPPVIGYKKLLNFEAFSVPDVGGWLLILAGVLVALAVAVAYDVPGRLLRGKRRVAATLLVALLAVGTWMACGSADRPVAVSLGQDQCEACKMAIMDAKFACEVITDKGKCLKFDDLSCLFHHLRGQEMTDSQVRRIYVADYQQPASLIDVKTASLVLGADIHSPMNGGVAAFADRQAAEAFARETRSELLDTWERLVQKH